MEETEQTIEQKEIDYKDLYIRLSADFDNYRKRLSKEKEEIKNSTKIKTLNCVLDVHNDLSLSINFSENSEGIKLILQKLENSLLKEGVSIIQTDIYDDNLHEVISIAKDVIRKDSEIPDNERINSVVSNGYLLNGNVIRYAKIVLVNGL